MRSQTNLAEGFQRYSNLDHFFISLIPWPFEILTRELSKKLGKLMEGHKPSGSARSKVAP